MTGRYYFEAVLVGSGDTPEEAWANAIEALSLDNGPAPDEYTVLEDE